MLSNIDQQKVQAILEKIQPRLNSVNVLRKVEEKLKEKGNDNAAGAVEKARLRKLEKVGQTITPEEVKQFLTKPIDSTDSAAKQKIVDEAQKAVKDLKTLRDIRKVQQDAKDEVTAQPPTQIQPIKPMPAVRPEQAVE